MYVLFVSCYTNIPAIGMRFYHCRFTQSKPDNESHVAVQIFFILGVANAYLPRVLHIVITDKIVIMKIT